MPQADRPLHTGPRGEPAGAFYTPRHVANFLAERWMLDWRAAPDGAEAPTVLDPACGHGELLAAALRQLSALSDVSDLSDLSDSIPPGPERLALARRCLFGADLDPASVEQTRRTLAAEALGVTADSAAARDGARQLAANVRVGDALVAPQDPGGATWAAALDWNDFEPVVRGGFDAVLANPPFLNSRHLARRHTPEALRQLRANYRCARGAFDCYVLFIERSWKLLRPGGRCAMVVPNKIGSLDYAQPCRSLLASQATLERLVDVSHLKLFPSANVYLYLLFWRKCPAPADATVAVWRPADGAPWTQLCRAACGDPAAESEAASPPTRGAEAPAASETVSATSRETVSRTVSATSRETVSRTVSQASRGSLSEAAREMQQIVLETTRETVSATTPEMHLAPSARRIPLTCLSAAGWRIDGDWDLEERTATRPLGELVALGVGTAGFAAARTAELLCEADAAEPSPNCRWIPFVCSGGVRRFRLRTDQVRFMRRLWRQPRLDLLDARLPEARRELYRSPKLVISGMGRRLRCVWHEAPLALGVQVYTATHPQLDPHYLSAVLNSKLMTRIFQLRFAAKRLAGGYLSINKGQLRQLPIPVNSTSDLDSPRRGLIDEVARLARGLQSRADGAAEDAIEGAIDNCVAMLYGLTKREQSELDRAVAPA